MKLKSTSISCHRQECKEIHIHEKPMAHNKQQCLFFACHRFSIFISKMKVKDRDLKEKSLFRTAVSANINIFGGVGPCVLPCS